MVHRLPIPFAHTNPINHDDISFPQIIHDKIFPRTAGQARKNTFKWTLIYQTLFQGKMKAIIANQDTIEGFNNEQIFFGGDPPKLVFTFPFHSNWILLLEERGKDIYLSVMSRSSKAYIPLSGATQKLQMSRNRRIICTNSAK
jgi:hypothetical protein